MTAPSVTLDEHTEADISHAAACEMHLWPHDQPCPDAAAHIAHVHVRGAHTADLLLCHSHATHMVRHIATCLSCGAWIVVVLEPIGRRAT